MVTRQNEDDRRGDPGKLPVYLSPYEYWNFGDGRDYAFPSIRKRTRYISAFAELVPDDPTDGLQRMEAPGLLPTLWHRYRRPKFLPFLAVNRTGDPILGVERLQEVLRDGLKRALITFDRVQATHQPASEVPIAPRGIKEGRFRVALPIPDSAVYHDIDAPTDPKPDPDEEVIKRIERKRRLTIMAIIDDGIPFAHRNFRDAEGRRTRVEFCWQQSACVDPDRKTVLFGREYMREDIERLVAQFGDDEDRLYHAAGATSDADDFGNLLGHHATHGAHVMNLATGYDPAHEGEPPEDIRIIAVQLPNSVTMDTSGFGMDMYVLAAFHYIFNRADIIRDMYEVPDPRLVINFSYGYTGGRHDGGTELEAAINELIELRRGGDRGAPTALVLAAGNTFLDRLHAEIGQNDFQRTGAVELPWRMQPNSRTPAYLELWFWANYEPPNPPFSIELRDPSGTIVQLKDRHGGYETSMQIGADDPTFNFGDPIRLRSVLNRHGNVIGQISADSHRDDGGNPSAKTEDGKNTGRWRALIVIAPTEPENARLPGADAGRWTVILRRRPEVPAIDYPIRCWIQRATDFESFRSGSRQSYFDDIAYEATRFAPDGDHSEEDSKEEALKTPVKRFGSLNGLATGKTSLVVAGYRLGAGLRSSLDCARPARYSAAGPLKHHEVGEKVDCSSMSDRSRALPGTISTGVRSGSRSFLQGTSAAAPFVARQLAEIFATEEDIPTPTPDDNYLSLLRGYRPEAAKRTSPPSDNGLGCRKDDPELIKARLGSVLVPPHWQPGIKGRVYPKGKPAEVAATPD